MTLDELFATGHVADLILGFMLVEGLLLAAFHVVTGRGLAMGEFLGNLISGACLLLALRLALVGGWWGWIATWLAAALLAHLADLWRRWRTLPRRSPPPAAVHGGVTRG